MVMRDCDATEFAKMTNNDKHKAQPLLKKRVNQWSHEVRKTITTSPERFIPLFYGDRFIPRRYALKENETNETFLFMGEREDFLRTKFSSAYLRYKGLKIAINNTFGVKHRKMLEFADLAEKSSFLLHSNVLPSVETYEFIYGNLNGYDWPCRPRSKFLACAETTHDLPHFDMVTELNLIDWSVDGQIAASFGQELVLWTPSLDLTLVYKISNSRSISYCPKGRFLAIGTEKYDYPVLELWDTNSAKELYLFERYNFRHKNCIVLCIEWAQNGKIIACGTSFGSVWVFCVPALNVIKVLKNHHQPVFMIKISPNMRFLATSDIEGNIYVYNWPSYEVHVVCRSKRKLRVVIDWHPWNGTDLAISEDSPASIVILHVPSREIVAYYQRKDRRVEIDFITFNKLTAELLVSYSNKDEDGCVNSEIVVMSSLDHVVDVLRVPDSSVRFMMWSPTGMQLATAGNDETLTIWNYLPNRYKNRIGRTGVVEKVRTLCPDVRKSKCAFDLSYGSEFKKWAHIK
ncbi:protein cortex [Episyrphus balteatus]|uniref:protein cortex n=1 Tax=Episyrphus balteatus TaxID=286459 RepID=UPI00248643EF|nr:protein cortex [Episyrphus balteatus]